MTNPNHSILKIEAYHCFLCGKPFGTKDLKKTQHHVIPQFLKPDRNILIPIHESCHQEINQYTIQSIPKLNSIDNFIKSMKQIINKYEKSVDKFKKLEK